VDLLGVSLEDVYQPIKEMFESETILKLGFRFKQDLVYLSHTFSTQGGEPGFDVVLLLFLYISRALSFVLIEIVTEFYNAA
jgi:hypothetical protein